VYSLVLMVYDSVPTTVGMYISESCYWFRENLVWFISVCFNLAYLLRDIES
jgi:hypothetical protein